MAVKVSFFLHHGTLSWRSLKPTDQEDVAMDDYQEELLEYQAFELDPLEPADDATEL